MLHLIEDALMDSVKLIPFLFLTYLAMEYLEHRTGEHARKLIRRPGAAEDTGHSPRRHFAAGLAAPIVGGLLGALPQCGFSAAASNLYAGRIITLGTLLAIYLSTSDEMLPILISEQASAAMILKILAAKAVIGMTAGLAIDLLYRKGNESREKIHDICRQERCHCEKGILRSALSHTVKIALFILAVNLGLNLILHFLGEEALENLILNRPFIGPLLAGLVGLIPNCAGSVVITQLYLAGSMGLGAALAGLLAGSGVGLLVLFRVNHDRRENLKILALLYGIGVAAGIAVDWIGLA
ncbi:putative manganese transporter [uncultured Acetatifactor sp.]|uniref:putative manganese transporter n=1 Tax=uncultured Acetatifactor sp. TaxID=1671927 RepID=UPI00260EDB04|nr:putative manganese transporter [uncultured Acetatifactor sp.]